MRIAKANTSPGHPTGAARVPPTYVDLNRVWVDSLVRAQAQALLEAPTLLRLGGPATGACALELGPGRRGTGLRLALDVFGAASVEGVELHADSVAACGRAVADLGPRACVRSGDATRLDAADASYDAVFCYHLLHHAPDWRSAVREAARVLRPGGQLYVAEMTARFIDSAPLRAVSFHPDDADRPTPASLEATAAVAGLRPVGQRTRYLGCWTALVARKDG